MVLAASVLTSKGLLISTSQIAISLAASLAASIVVFLMYHIFYGSRNIGAGVDRTFLIGGPAITALFLGIQSSIPLSLGLLGALSFVRFRTPVKDPAEIGFLLLLIASSIGAATGTYAIMIILLAIVLACLTVHWLIKRRFTLGRFTDLIVSMDRTVFTGLEPRLRVLLGRQLKHIQMKTLTVMDGRISVHYQFKTANDLDRCQLAKAITDLAAPSNVEVFIGPA
ncbi:MAG: DUF4956 domain-containing protein [Sedimentisphaerales bacterium]|nr:DUF4956 domain-containing protein [Sedimentisphaerales bacterium]